MGSSNEPFVLLPVARVALRDLIVANWLYGALIVLLLLVSFHCASSNRFVRGEAFTVENASRLKAIAWALLGLGLLPVCVVAIASAVSTTELAERIDIALPNLSILKTGNARAIRFSTPEAICEALDCQPGELLEYRASSRTGKRLRAA